MKRAFLDTNIILDLLGKRLSHYYYAAELFTLAEKKSIQLYVSSLTFSNLYYILRKIRNRETAIISLKKLKLLIKILSVDNDIIERSLISNFNDFEDAIQYHTAKTNSIDYLITRNIKDFTNCQINILLPEEYLKIFSFK